MYLCLDCKNTFIAPQEYIERHGFSHPPYETFYVCPYCGGGYVKTFPCGCCGDWVTGKYIELDDGTVICEDCYEIKDIEAARW